MHTQCTHNEKFTYATPTWKQGTCISPHIVLRQLRSACYKLFLTATIIVPIITIILTLDLQTVAAHLSPHKG